MEWYRVVRVRPWSRALAYLAAFCVTVSTVLAFLILPSLLQAAGEFRTWAAAKIPAEAEFAFADHKFSTTLETPYEISEEGESVVIDPGVTDLQFPSSRYEKAGIVVGRDAVFMNRGRGQWQIQDFREVPDWKTTGRDVQQAVAKFGVPAAFAIFAIFALVSVVALFVGSIAYAFLAAAMAWGLGLAFRVNLKFSQWLAVCFTAVTLPTLADMALNFFGTQIPYAFSFIFFAFVIAVLVDERQRPTTPVAADAGNKPA